MRDSDLNRLLCSAAKSREPSTSVPFGFDTRVMALWRASKAERGESAGEISRLVRRIVIAAAIVTVFSGIGAYRELSENEETGEPSTNVYAIADTAIERGLFE